MKGSIHVVFENSQNLAPTKNCPGSSPTWSASEVSWQCGASKLEDLDETGVVWWALMCRVNMSILWRLSKMYDIIHAIIRSMVYVTTIGIGGVAPALEPRRSATTGGLLTQTTWCRKLEANFFLGAWLASFSLQVMVALGPGKIDKSIKSDQHHTLRAMF